MTAPKAPLFAYLGLDDYGKLNLYVSTQQLNIIGTRLEKGSKFPHEVYDLIDDPKPELAVPALRGLQDYFDGKDSRSTLTFGEKIRKKKR